MISVAWLIPPPIPPPAPELLSAASEVRAAAPVDEAMRQAEYEAAAHALAFDTIATLDPGSMKYQRMVPAALERTNAWLTGERAAIHARVDACLDEQLGGRYDLATLQDMRDVAVTRGGNALWQAAIRHDLRRCTANAVR